MTNPNQTAAAADLLAAAAAAQVAADGGEREIAGDGGQIAADGAIIRKEVRRTISPYDLTSADNPGAVISHPLLKGSNYDEWACGLKTALCSRKKFGFLDGTIVKPAAGSADLEDWLTINALLVSWIRMTIDPNLRSNISHREVAKDLWDHLKKRFSVMNGPRIQQIKADLAGCRQRGIAVEEYFGKLNRIWDSLASYRPIRYCKCDGNTCDFVALQEADREEDKVHQFLFGLDDQYRTVRSNLVARVPLPSLEEVYNIVRQEEDMRGNQVEKSEVMAFAVQNRTRQNRFRSEDGGGSMCRHCNRGGHSSDSCFAVIGYPEWWGERPKGRSNPEKGKGISLGFQGNRGKANVNQVHVSHGEKSAHVNHVITDRDRDGVSGLSEDQWQMLRSLLNSRKDTHTEKLSGKYSFPSWILDTGASHHLTGCLDILMDVRDIAPVMIVLADGRERVSVKEGTVHLGSDLTLKSVFYVEELQSDLISIGQLMDENSCVVQLSDKFLVIQDRISKMVIGAGRRVGGMYRLCSLEFAGAVKAVGDDKLTLWHNRMGHAPAKVVALLPSVSVSSKSFPDVCDVCLRAKQTRDVFPISLNKSLQIFELIHIDLWGPYRTASHSGARYFLTVVDDYSRGVWIYLLNDKSEAPDKLKEFLSLTERQFDVRVKSIRSDNGTEFVCLDRFFSEQGIEHQTSCVGTPQQNGRVERKHRHILNVARALRFQAHLPIEFWGECILTAAYLINRTPTQLLENLTPYEKLYGKPPPYSHLRVFGSLCYAHIQMRGGDKFAPRSRKCIFVGYPHGKRGWRLYDLEKGEFFVSRDVRFSENEFPYAQVSDTGDAPTCIPDACIGAIDIDQDEVDVDHEVSVGLQIDSPAPCAPQTPVIETPEIPPDSQTGRLGRGCRERCLPSKLQNYVLNMAASTSTSSTVFPISDYDSDRRFSTSHRAYVASILTNEIPNSYQIAVKDSRWREAMSKEIDALETNQTWSLETLPPGKHAIGSKWVYTIKYNSDGSIERYKARLVALGNRQVEGEDFGETYAPVAKMGTVRLFLDVAAKRGWTVHQMDVHNAFLHGDLSEEVFMRMPPGFQATTSGTVCRLHKSLYGLRQAPRCWFAKLSTALIHYGFEQSLSDYSLFTMETSDVRLHILVYVDDLIIAGSSDSATKAFKQYLSSCFHMKDLGPLKYFLGIEVARNELGFYLCQRKYALDIISETGLLGAKPAMFPLEQNHRLALSESPEMSDPQRFRRLLGKLIYLAVTRPDLAYSVHVLAQFMQAPREDHWTAALRVVRYLKLDPGQGILLRSSGEFQVTGWCDSDWASCPLTRRSVTGYLVQIGDSPVSWKTRKQPTVSRSSAEAEYRALACLTQELIWIKRMLGTLGVIHTQPMIIRCDSKSAIHIATNPVFHERTKHIELDCHFVRDEIQSGNVAMTHVESAAQLADIFTKAVGRDGFLSFRSKLGLQNLYAPT